MPTPDPTTVTVTERPWSEEVALADSCAPVPREPWVYEFAGGKRRFIEREDPYNP